MTTMTPGPRRWRPTKLQPLNLTLSQQPCVPCEGRGFAAGAEGCDVATSVACAICQGTGRRC